MEPFNELKSILARAHDLSMAEAVLSWEQETYMPKGGAGHRADQLATLGVLAHETFTQSRVGELLSALEPLEAAQDPDTDDAALLRVTRREYRKATRFPAEFVEEVSRAHNAAHFAWIEARKTSTFETFKPFLEKNIELARKSADLLGYQDHPYDALLDQYEPGARTADIRRIFGDLREQTLPLLRAIQAKGDATDYSVLERHFPTEQQQEFGLKIARQLGLPEAHSRLDVSAHPFCTHFGSRDIRITTRFDEHYFPTSLFGTWHETGHGLYEYGVALELDRTPLAGGASLGVHESQSRMFENLVCRSKPFWERAYPELQALVPEVTAGVSLEDFYKAINRVQASLIRVEADEVTYNFHIMLRFELETALLEGSLKVADLPEAWNARMQEFLGVTPPNDAQGVLQDVHWSAGLIGYFPTYSLGNLLSVQLWNAAQRELGDLGELVRQGNFAPIVEWMRVNVHQHGKKLLPHEIALRATGRPLEATDYVQYLKSKYSDVYGL